MGHVNPASGGTVNVKAHRRERGASVPIKRLSSVPIYCVPILTSFDHILTFLNNFDLFDPILTLF